MTDKISNTNPITYRLLHEALTTLGFTRKKTKEYLAYRDTKHDALIILPAMTDQTLVGAPHLVVVQNTVTLKGVASQAKLEALLSHAGEAQTALKKTYGRKAQTTRPRERQPQNTAILGTPTN